MLGKAGLGTNYHTNPVELGFPESNCHPSFAQADGAVNVNLRRA